MTKPILHLHAGPWKTGSTAIQWALAASRQEMKAAGFFVPSPEKNHRFIVSAFLKRPEDFDYNKLAGRNAAELPGYNRKMLDAFEKQLAESGCPNAIISSEHLGLLDGDELASLYQYLEPLFSEIKVYLYIRHPCEQVGSKIQETVKSCEARLSDLYQNPPYEDYIKDLSAWAAAFGRDAVGLHAFHPSTLKDGDVVTDFFNWVGAGEVALSQADQKANESLSYPALLLADALMEHASKYSPRRVPKKFLQAIEGPPYNPPASVVDKVAELAEPQLAYLSKEWGIDLPEPRRKPPSKEMCTAETFTSLAKVLDGLANREKPAPPSLPRKVLRSGKRYLKTLIKRK